MPANDEFDSDPTPASSSSAGNETLRSDASAASTPRAERLAKAGARRRRKARDRSGDLFLFLVVGGLILLFVLVEPQRILSFMMDPKVGVFLLVLVVQYLILKSTDRTRVYEMENTRLRDQKRVDQLAMKRAREIIEEGMRDETVLTPDAWSAWRAKADGVRNELKGRM